jgi:hypothetical protein
MLYHFFRYSEWRIFKKIQKETDLKPARFYINHSNKMIQSELSQMVYGTQNNGLKYSPEMLTLILNTTLLIKMARVSNNI